MLKNWILAFAYWLIEWFDKPHEIAPGCTMEVVKGVSLIPDVPGEAPPIVRQIAEMEPDYFSERSMSNLSGWRPYFGEAVYMTRRGDDADLR